MGAMTRKQLLEENAQLRHAAELSRLLAKRHDAQIMELKRKLGLTITLGAPVPNQNTDHFMTVGKLVLPQAQGDSSCSV